MSDLHPTARALIERAKRREAPLPEEVRGRVHRSVLRRAVALGAAVATTTSASVAAKAGALAGALSTPLVASAALSGLAGVAFLVASAVSKPSGPVRPPSLTAATQPVAHRPAVPLTVVPERAAPPIPTPSPVVVPEATAPSRKPKLDAPPVRLPASVPALAPTTTPAGRGREDSAQSAELALPPAKNVQGASETALAETPTRGPDEGAKGQLEPALVQARAPSAMARELAAELDLLHEVHAALRARQADRALALLDRWGRSSGPRPLDEEAEAARVSALCQLGRDSDAQRAIERFVARWPGSPLASRLQGGCAALGANAGDPRN